MTPSIQAAMLAISSSLGLSIVAKVTVVTALGLAVVWLARGSRAAVRHALLATVFAVVLLLPIASVVVAPIHLTVPVTVESRAAASPPFGGVEAIPSVTTAYTDSRVLSVMLKTSSLSFSDLLLVGWIAGAAIFLLPVVIGLWQIRSLRRSGLWWRRGQSIVGALAIDAGIHRRVELLLHEALTGPMTCGVLHPAIVLPRDAENWKGEDLDRAIVHELEHVRRGDSLSHCLARAACAVYWFHPLVWMAWRKLELEAERSCDDAVLRGSEATAYADQLVGLAKRLSVGQRPLLLAMANRIDLSTRVRAVLDIRQRRGRLGTFSVALACAAAVVLVMTMSPLIVVAAPQAVSAQTPKFDVASIKLNKSGRVGWDGFKISHGNFNVANASLHMLITGAFHLQNAQVSGGAGWLTTDRFDINAKGDQSASHRQVLQMLQSLLTERFGLVVHREIKDLPIYALVSTKNGSSKLQRAKDGVCDTPAPETSVDAPKGGKTDFMQAIPCGETGAVMTPQGVILWGKSVSISSVADALSDLTGLPVVDRTGISGQFEFKLRWSDGSQHVRNENEGPREAIPNSEAPPSIFVALPEQLGLKLERAKGPVEVLVIDHVEKPSQN
jgi:bla regulator protein BlaR1